MTSTMRASVGPTSRRRSWQQIRGRELGALAPRALRRRRQAVDARVPRYHRRGVRGARRPLSRDDARGRARHAARHRPSGARVARGAGRRGPCVVCAPLRLTYPPRPGHVCCPGLPRPGETREVRASPALFSRRSSSSGRRWAAAGRTSGVPSSSGGATLPSTEGGEAGSGIPVDCASPAQLQCDSGSPGACTCNQQAPLDACDCATRRSRRPRRASGIVPGGIARGAGGGEGTFTAAARRLRHAQCVIAPRAIASVWPSIARVSRAIASVPGPNISLSDSSAPPSVRS